MTELRTLTALVEAAREAYRAGEWDEALAQYETAFQRLRVEGTPRQAAELLRWIGHIHRQRGDAERACEVYEASLAVAEANDDADASAEALNSLAILEQFGGRPSQAETLYVRARTIAQSTGNARLAAMVEQNMGALANMRGDATTALRSYSAALERYLELEDHLSAAAALNNMGMVHRDREAWDPAEQCFGRAAELAGSVGHPDSIAYIELNRGELFVQRQRYEQARESCDRAMELFSGLGSKKGLAEVHRLYGSLYRNTSRHRLADIHLTLGLQLARAVHDRLVEAEAQNERARLYLESGRHRGAIQALNHAYRLFGLLEAQRQLADIERRLEHLSRGYLAAAEGWSAEAIESKDPFTAGHSLRVAEYACRLAEAVGFDGWDLTGLRVGGLLHDIGKSIVPATVLTKPSTLTAEERHLIRKHPVAGEAIVSELDFPWELKPLIRHHHERWDGGGYPDGLQGGEIPLEARLMTIVDVYDAMTSRRAYHDAFSHDDALELMAGARGRQLDPELFDAFRALIDESWTAEANAASLLRDSSIDF